MMMLSCSQQTLGPSKESPRHVSVAAEKDQTLLAAATTKGNVVSVEHMTCKSEPTSRAEWKEGWVGGGEGQPWLLISMYWYFVISTSVLVVCIASTFRCC